VKNPILRGRRGEIIREKDRRILDKKRGRGGTHCRKGSKSIRPQSGGHRYTLSTIFLY